MFEQAYGRDIAARLRWFREKGNLLQLKFDFQALVIDRLEKAASLLCVNGKARADDGVAFVFVN